MSNHNSLPDLPDGYHRIADSIEAGAGREIALMDIKGRTYLGMLVDGEDEGEGVFWAEILPGGELEPRRGLDRPYAWGEAALLD